jgi:hypothetical protein
MNDQGGFSCCGSATSLFPKIVINPDSKLQVFIVSHVTGEIKQAEARDLNIEKSGLLCLAHGLVTATQGENSSSIRFISWKCQSSQDTTGVRVFTEEGIYPATLNIGVDGEGGEPARVMDFDECPCFVCSKRRRNCGGANGIHHFFND